MIFHLTETALKLSGDEISLAFTGNNLYYICVMKLLLNLFKKKPTASLLALYIDSVTNETFLEQLYRQGRIYEYLALK